MSESNKVLLKKDNLQECFGRFVERLHKRTNKEVPKKLKFEFKGIAESTSVDTNSFSCNATSLAIIRQKPILVDKKQTDYFSLELHALCSDIFMDVHKVLEYGTRKEIIDLLSNKDYLVEQLIKVFYDLDKSLSDM